MTSSITNRFHTCTNDINNKIRSVKDFISYGYTSSPTFKRLLWIPGIAVVVGAWRARIVHNELSATRGVYADQPESDMHGYCLGHYARLQLLTSIVKMPITADIALIVVAKAVLAAVLPVFSAVLFYLAVISIVGRISVAGVCYNELLPYREGVEFKNYATIEAAITRGLRP